MAANQRTILLVGGGSGGHIYPNLAVVERLDEMGLCNTLTPHLVVSERPLDAKIAEDSGLAFTAIPAAPLAMRPAGMLRFWRQYRWGRAATTRLIRDTNAAAMIATGGFVSGPAVAAAQRAGIPVALVSLDAVPGRANRFTAKHATRVFSAFPTHDNVEPLPGAEVIGFPQRHAAVASSDISAGEARKHFALKPDKRTLLIFAGSQGAATINAAMRCWASGGGGSDVGVLKAAQVLHVAGPGEGEAEQVRAAYDAANVRAVVLPFCDRMDLAWRAANSGGAGLTRAGAGTVAEAWANAVPCVMLPYPYHKDEHQKHNAVPLLERGGAVVVSDLIDATQNAVQLSAIFASILKDDANRERMSAALRDRPPEDGAQRLADWVREVV
ncbi:MAG: UDP-N-acetylglucosamine--N-acetylmuramyl-(pentapeptide) pyrophosphoryl-undecaprenol N-acetylglucosamine transferase [Planctomycetota bacterium]